LREKFFHQLPASLGPVLSPEHQTVPDPFHQ
jgi:hypothetical protein